MTESTPTRWRFEELIEQLDEVHEGWVRDYLKNTLAAEQLRQIIRATNLPTELGALEELQNGWRSGRWSASGSRRRQWRGRLMDWEDRMRPFSRAGSAGTVPSRPAGAGAARKTTHVYDALFNNPNGTRA